MLILKIFGTIDIISGIALLIPEILLPMCSIIGTIVLLKGIYSVSSSLFVGYFYDIMGILDLLAGITLILSFNIPLLWILMIIKGIASLF